MADKNVLTTSIVVEVALQPAWELWNNPADIMQWNNTDESWENLKVENDLRPGGRFLFAMAKKDGTEKFDFEGTYDEVETYRWITYTLDDGRKTKLTFTGSNPVTITETFDAKPNLPLKMQEEFCHAVLITFKNYAEGKRYA